MKLLDHDYGLLGFTSRSPYRYYFMELQATKSKPSITLIKAVI